jgi:hypothetical protein
MRLQLTCASIESNESLVQKSDIDYFTITFEGQDSGRTRDLSQGTSPTLISVEPKCPFG